MAYRVLKRVFPAAVFLASATSPLFAGDWSGIYVGGGLSLRDNTVAFPNGTDRLTMVDTTAPGLLDFEKIPNLVHSGNTIGGHLLGGVRFQYNRFVFGLEGDYEFNSSFSVGRSPGIPECGNAPVPVAGAYGCVGLKTFFSDAKTLGHVRGVVGMEMTPTLLGFVAGGLAIGKSPDVIGASAGGFIASSPSTPLLGAATVTRSDMAETIYGYSIGGGLEVKTGGGVSLRAEYMFDKYKSHEIAVGGAGFGGTINELTTNSFTGPGDRVDMSSHAIRVSAIYQFSPGDEPETLPAYATESDWSGLYVGGGISMERHRLEFLNAINFLNITNNVNSETLAVNPANEHEGDSIGGHLLAGYAHQFGRFVVGGEVDVDFGSSFSRERTIGGPECLTTPVFDPPVLDGGEFVCVGTRLSFSEVKTLGHARLKAGFEITPMLMGFVAGGLAVGKSADQFSASVFGAVASNPSSPLLGAATVTRSGLGKTVYGYSIGGGVEMKASHNIRLRTEYIYDDYGSIESLPVGGAGFGGTIGDLTINSFVSPGDKVRLTSHTFRLSAIYQF